MQHNNGYKYKWPNASLYQTYIYKTINVHVTMFAAHAKEALNLAKMQEETTQLEHQTKYKVGTLTFQIVV